jgi:hypothetical protein
VAVLPFAAGIAGSSALSPREFATGFRTAVIIAGITCAVGGVLAAAFIRNPPGPSQPIRASRWQCALDASPLESTVATLSADRVSTKHHQSTQA